MKETMFKVKDNVNLEKFITTYGFEKTPLSGAYVKYHDNGMLLLELNPVDRGLKTFCTDVSSVIYDMAQYIEKVGVENGTT